MRCLVGYRCIGLLVSKRRLGSVGEAGVCSGATLGGDVSVGWYCSGTLDGPAGSTLGGELGCLLDDSVEVVMD